jgi:hypothetical protein
MTQIRAWIRTHQKALIMTYLRSLIGNLTKVLSMAVLLRREEDEKENEIL